MQDKITVKRTRSGIEEKNLSTGESRMLTTSDYAQQYKYTKEMRYQPTAQRSLKNQEGTNTKYPAALLRPRKYKKGYTASIKSTASHLHLYWIAEQRKKISFITRLQQRNRRRAEGNGEPESGDNEQEASSGAKEYKRTGNAYSTEGANEHTGLQNSTLADGKEEHIYQRAAGVKAHQGKQANPAMQKYGAMGDSQFLHYVQTNPGKGIVDKVGGGIGVIAAALLMVLLFLLIVPAALGSVFESPEVSPSNKGLNKEVLAHKPMVERYCIEFGIEEYIMYLLAIMQVESGGRGEDVMQASESLGLPPNSLSTKESIEQGCRYFASLLDSSYGCDIRTITQSYNYGGGFISYVSQRGKKYSFSLAEEFALKKSGGVKVNYPNPVAIPVNGGWRYRYGNMFYVQLVEQYLNSGGGMLNPGGFICPLDNPVYGSPYGMRNGKLHGGQDFPAGAGTPIYAVADGVVETTNKWNGSYSGNQSWGNYVIIRHSATSYTLYAHASKLLVTAGQTVNQGDQIALVGNTGVSTGNHLHWEVWEGGYGTRYRKEPTQYLP